MSMVLVKSKVIFFYFGFVIIVSWKNVVVGVWILKSRVLIYVKFEILTVYYLKY